MSKLFRGLLAVAALAAGIFVVGVANDPVPTPECPVEICGAAR
jgi:hypothetical protein